MKHDEYLWISVNQDEICWNMLKSARGNQSEESVNLPGPSLQGFFRSCSLWRRSGRYWWSCFLRQQSGARGCHWIIRCVEFATNLTIVCGYYDQVVDWIDLLKYLESDWTAVFFDGPDIHTDHFSYIPDASIHSISATINWGLLSLAMLAAKPLLPAVHRFTSQKAWPHVPPPRKGAARAVRMPRVEALCHSLEVTDWHGARSGSSWKINLQKVQSTRTQLIHVYPLLLESSVVGKLNYAK